MKPTLFGHSYGTLLAQRVLAFDDSLFKNVILQGVVACARFIFCINLKKMVENCKRSAICRSKLPGVDTIVERFENFNHSDHKCYKDLFENKTDMTILPYKDTKMLAAMETYMHCSQTNHSAYEKYFTSTESQIRANGGAYHLITSRDMFVESHSSSVSLPMWYKSVLSRFQKLQKKYPAQDHQRVWYKGFLPVFILQGERDYKGRLEGCQKSEKWNYFLPTINGP